MGNLYLITGPAGVGKSTISKGIAESLEKSVLLEGDDFYHHVVGGYVQAWKEDNHLDIFWKVCIDTINNYLNAGYDVIFNYIIGIEDYNKLKEIFKEINTKFVVLLVDENTIIQRDQNRPLDCQMKDRCIVLLNEFKNAKYDEKHILHTDNLSITDTINEIISNDRFKI